MPSMQLISIGARVQTHPATDEWMRGDRFGEVILLTTSKALVLLDSGIRTWFPLSDLY